MNDSDRPSTDLPRIDRPRIDSAEAEISEATFQAIGRILKARYGFALESYKDKCVKRRINIRVRATRLSCAEAYAELLAETPLEQEHLLKVLTIHVSHFFRNPSTFRKLADEVLPELFLLRPDGELVLWSVGCASGEEPYSLALILKERFARELTRQPVRIVATDVDQTILTTAEQGLYAPERMMEVSDRTRARWFAPEGERYRLSPEIRQMVAFQQGDLNLGDCSVASDLILCRNVLIYFERKRQEEILLFFARALRPGGILVLGKAETMVGEARRHFRTLCPVERIYRLA